MATQDREGRKNKMPVPPGGGRRVAEFRGRMEGRSWKSGKIAPRGAGGEGGKRTWGLRRRGRRRRGRKWRVSSIGTGPSILGPCHRFNQSTGSKFDSIQFNSSILQALRPFNCLTAWSYNGTRYIFCYTGQKTSRNLILFQAIC